MLGVPVFREDRAMVEEAIRSFLDPLVNVVVVDNGATEEAKAAIATFHGEIDVIHNSTNIYVNPALNQIAERFLRSNGEILVLANADVLVRPGWAESLLARRERGGNELWFGRRTWDVKETNVSRRHSANGTTHDHWLACDDVDTPSHGGFFAMTRKAVPLCFPIPTSLRMWYGDIWVFEAILRAYYRYVTLTDIVVWHGESISQKRMPQIELDGVIKQDRKAWARRRGNREMFSPTIYRSSIGDRYPLLVLPRPDDVAYFDTMGGAPEAPLIAWAEKLIAPGDAFWDVGSHIGSWAIYFALCGHPVRAFEAHPELADFVRAGAAINHISDRLHVEACAVSDRDGSAMLKNPTNSESGGGGSIVCDYHGNTMNQVMALTCTLDSARPAEHHVGLLKIDVEGAELAVLRGATDFLRQHRPRIIFECWEVWRGNGPSPTEDLFAILAGAKYDVRRTTWPEVWVADPQS